MSGRKIGSPQNGEAIQKLLNMSASGWSCFVFLKYPSLSVTFHHLFFIIFLNCRSKEEWNAHLKEWNDEFVPLDDDEEEFEYDDE